MSIYVTLYLLFLKIGFLSFGGGYPMMGLIFEEGQAAVGLTAAEFADMAALELLASGPVAINSATYIGYIKGGFLGSLTATLGVCTPPFILTTLLFLVLKRFEENIYVQGFIQAIKVACGGILMSTAFSLGREIFFLETGETLLPFGLLWPELLIFLLCLLAILKFKVNPIAAILGSAVLGVVLIR